ncbi:MAG TPA: hypothetical protein PLB92_14130 [Rhodoglobus sp.]|nr:hypothetical protein [Rhodoglobus sp.]
MAGLSGKKVVIAGDFAIKEATPAEIARVHELHKCSYGFIAPCAEGETSYVMPRLREFVGTTEEYVDFAVATLPQLWQNAKHSNEVGWAHTRGEIIKKFGTWFNCLPQQSSVDLRGGVVIHGDPTRENLMRRIPSGALVFIDPLPMRTYAPGMPIFDVAKVVQSLLGWDGPPADKEVINAAVARFGFYDMKLVAMFVKIQLLRIKPYLGDDPDTNARWTRVNDYLKEWDALL